MLWILGSGPVADAVQELTAIPRWMLELGKGLLFVAITAVVLQVLMRHRADRLDTAAANAATGARRLAESETRNSLQATALAGTANPVVITDREGTIEWVNAGFEMLSGYPSSVAVGSRARLLTSEGQDEEFRRELWETILAGRVWRGQVVNRRSDGELYTVSQTITPVVTGSGEIEHFVAVQEDISERVRVERQLEASRVQLQALFDHALDAIMLADDGGRYLQVNAAVSEMTGYSRQELLGMGPGDLAAPDREAVDVETQFAEFLQSGAESGTFALRHKDGHVVETEYRAVPNIQPGVHLSILRDVTARNAMLRAITIAETEFRDLAENAVDIVAKVRVDRAGGMQVDYINPAITTILGYPQERLYTDPDVLHEMFQHRVDGIEGALEHRPSGAEPIGMTTTQVQASDGRLVWLEVSQMVTDPSTDPVTIQVVARDVTARYEMARALERALTDQIEAAEQLRTLGVMKDTFLQSVSHELRTPLTSILGFAQMLADPATRLAPAVTEDFHRGIVRNGHRLQRLLDDLLDVDRLARGHIEPTRHPTDVSELVERMVADIELGDHPVTPDLEPITMDLDAPWVERIVDNLLRNVVRHTPPATSVWVRTRATPEGMELIVDDDGPGVPEADRQRVVEPFEQGAGAASSAQPGTGVGLSLVNTFAQLHGGGLTISQSPAGGVRATVVLAHPDIPFLRAADGDPVPPDSAFAT